MRVLFLKGLSAWALGGDRTETIRLVQGAAQRGGCDVALAADALPNELAGIRHFKVDYPQTPAVDGQVRAALSAFKPDVVHVIGAGIRFLEAFERTLGNNVPWVFTAHNVPPAEKIFSRFFGRPALYYAARDALAWPSVRLWSRFLRRGAFARVVCHSDTVARRLVARGTDPARVINVPFGCDEPVIDPTAASPFPAGASPRVLTVAGFAPHKGQLDAVHAVARLLPEFPNLAYRMIGNPRPDERYARFVEREVKRLGVGANVALIEDASEAVKQAALRDTDLYVQPSHEEGFCIAFLEAATVAPRLVGTDTGAIREIARGDASMRVVRPRDVDALAREMRALLSEPANADLAGTERWRRALAERYSWTRYVEQHLEAYHAVLAGLPSGTTRTS